MSQNNKRSILLSFDEDVLLHLRKQLFPVGISVQDFFVKIAEMAIYNPNDFNEILEEVKIKKLEKIEKGDVCTVDQESLYEFFEEKLKQKQ